MPPMPTTMPPMPTTMPPTTMPTRPNRELEARRQHLRAEQQNRRVMCCSITLLVVATLTLLIWRMVARRGHGLSKTPELGQALLMMLALGGSGVLIVFCRRHIWLRRQSGYHTAFFDCLDLRPPADPRNPRPALVGEDATFDLSYVSPIARLPDNRAIR